MSGAPSGPGADPARETSGVAVTAPESAAAVSPLGSDAAAVAPDWQRLRDLTLARVGLGRTGVSLPTSALLSFEADHALAKDAVHAPFDAAAFAAELAGAGIATMVLATEATSREQHLRRPDRGRHLDEHSRDRLRAFAVSVAAPPAHTCDVALIVSDGLSAGAVAAAGIRVLTRMVPLLRAAQLTVGPVVVVPFGRVGLLNDVGATLRARSAVILLGERPGLTAVDSLSGYFEFSPQPGMDDAQRNCVSNIRDAGLPPEVAGEQLAQLVLAGLRTQRSGTSLKLEFPTHPQIET